jgi:hypothetical protein
LFLGQIWLLGGDMPLSGVLNFVCEEMSEFLRQGAIGSQNMPVHISNHEQLLGFYFLKYAR